jgi:hypothetical protein
VSDVPAPESAAERSPETPLPAPPSPGSPAPQRWWESTRFKIALGIAVAECIFVAMEDEFSRITVVVIAIPIVLFHLLAGRSLDSPRQREISWILAMSQALAAVAAIIAWMVPVVALVLAGLFAAAAVYLLVHERPDRRGDTADSGQPRS